MPCISCGFRKEKYYVCHKCGKPVCHQCMCAGLCKDCFNLIECQSYIGEYEYGEIIK